MSDEVHWQGACELVGESATRVGTLYLLDDALHFLEGGRLPKGGLTAARALLFGAACLALFFAKTGPAPGEDATTLAVALRGLIGLLALSAVGAAIQATRKRRRDDQRLLTILAEPVDVPSVAALVALMDAAPGSFRLATSDLREAEATRDKGLRLRSRLDDVYVMQVRPDRDGLLAALRPRLGEGGDGDDTGLAPS